MDWKEKGRKILQNSGYTSLPSSANNDKAWKKKGYEILTSDGYIPVTKRKYPLSTLDGQSLGTVGYDAYLAIKQGRIDKYLPKNNEEKQVIDSFKSYANYLTNAQAEQEKNNRIQSNPAFARYNIDPDNFTKKDFSEWAEQHGYEYRAGGNDLSGAEMKWFPKADPNVPFWKFWDVLPSKQEQEDKKVLEQLAENNHRKESSKKDSGAASAAIVSAIDGLTFGAVNAYADWEAKRDYKKAGLDPEKFTSYTEANAKTSADHKVASTIGNMAGSLAALSAVNGVVGGVTRGIKWITSTPKWVQSAINSGITFAAISGTETAFDGGNAEDILRNAGINLLGGAAGGSLSNIVGGLGEKFLFNKQLQHKVIPEIVRNGLSASVFAGGKTASTYFLYPKEHRPTAEEMTKDLTVAFAFGAISSAIHSINVTKQSKQTLDKINKAMTEDFKKMTEANIAYKNGERVTVSIGKLASNVAKYADLMDDYLKGKGVDTTIDGQTYTIVPHKARFIGQDKYVKSMLADLQTIRSNANAVLNGVPNGAESATASSAPTHSANIAPPVSDSNIVSTANKTNVVPAVAEPVLAGERTQGNVSVNPEITTRNSQETAPLKTNIFTGELDEIAESGSVTRFAPKNASADIQNLENALIEKGVSDERRQSIINKSITLEKSLNNNKKSVGNIVSGVEKLTNTVAKTFENTVGNVKNYWGLYDANLSMFTTPDTLLDENFAKTYANAFVESLQANNSTAYAALSEIRDDVSSFLTNYVLTGKAPETVSDINSLNVTADALKNILISAANQTVRARNEVYDENTVLAGQVAAINDGNFSAFVNPNIVQNSMQSMQNETLTMVDGTTVEHVGNFYEAYGEAAESLAKKLNLQLTPKIINGEKVPMVGFPAHAFEKYNERLNALASANSENVHEAEQNAETNEIVDGIEMLAGKTAQPFKENIVKNDVISEKPLKEEQKSDIIMKKAKLSHGKFTLEQTKHTKTGEDLWVIKPKERLPKEQFNELRDKMKELGGYWSSFVQTETGKGGFVFKAKPDAEVVKTFNSFFDESNESITPATVKEIDTDSLFGAVWKANTGDVIKRLDHAENGNRTGSETTTIDEVVGDEERVNKNALEVSEKISGNMPVSEPKHEKNPSVKIADYVKAQLEQGNKISSDALFKKVTQIYGGKMADNVFTAKDAYDAMELGVNQYILSLPKVSAQKMLDILELLPTQTKRTDGMDKFQQFSTPPSIAYLANYAANVNSKDTMLEPSAGIGGIALFAKKDGATVYVNELDDRRLGILKNMPFDKFFNEDAEQINNILGNEFEPSVIVMNPPFSSSSERNIKNTKIGAKHIEQALKILAPNGRLVAIVGNGMADGAPAFRNWWKDIKAEYNVVANIGIDGKNYTKYGTSFDIQMLVIDKNGSTTTTETGKVDTIEELQERLGDIRNARPEVDYGNEPGTDTTTRQKAYERSKGGLQRERSVPDTGGGRDTGKSSDVSVPQRKSILENTRQSDDVSGRTDNNESESTDVVVDDGTGERRGISGESKGIDGNTDSSAVSDSVSQQPDVSTGRDRSDGNSGDGRSKKRIPRLKYKELTDSIFEQYQTPPLPFDDVKAHPGKISESAAMSAIEAPKVTYKPHLSNEIISNGVVSDVQLESVSRAGQCHEQILPNQTRRGYFIGDGTGLGKGRTIAAILLDNYNQGRKKSVWVTINSSLVNDAKRDIKALFGTSDLVTEFEGGKKADNIYSKDEAVLVVSYSTLSRGYDKQDSNLEKITKWLGKDFDGAIIFDEAHKMAKATSVKGARGETKPSQTALAGIALQNALPKARIVYSSATGATDVENLRYAERLGLWGEGTPFVTGDDFVSKIKAGGLAAMELVARDMKAMGVYLSRNISYEDVTYDRIVHKLTAEQHKIYDELAKSWQIVLQNIEAALKTTNQTNDGDARGRALGAFWGAEQRFFNQILTSMQVPSVIADIEKQLADGKSCVIQLVSTNEAAQNEEFARIKSEDLDLEEFDITPKQMLMSFIENGFPVIQYEKYTDDNGNVRSKPVYDSKGNPVLNREAINQREELLSKLGSIKVPSSPLDMIINHFGSNMVAENTGRSRRVINKNGKMIEEKIGNKKDADVDAFQNGKKRIIIFSKAGGTGKSYHADKSAKNQQQRVHYLLEAGWQADNAVQGFGRSHRSNQAIAPIFKLVTTDLKGQMRFISTIAKRLDQLGALTKGQRQTGSQGMFSASDNLENSFAADVLSTFYKDLVKNKVAGISDGVAILEKIGLKSKILDEYGQIIVSAPELREVNKFLNRILSLDSKEQNTVFDGYAERLQTATEKAIQDGTLDKGLENYKADKITLNEVKDIRTDENTGASTKYYHLTAQNKIKPIEFHSPQINTDSPAFVGYYQNKNTGAVRAVFKTNSTTDQYGNVTDNYKLYGQIKAEYLEQMRFMRNWMKLEAAEAEKLWNDEIAKLPEYSKENLHLISGVVLPVWDKLPTENVHIYRVLTGGGEMLIGRVIPEDKIDGTLRMLGSSRTKEKISTSDLIKGIQNGDTVYLENGWKMVQRKVSNENRIELIGPTYNNDSVVKKKGVFTERISYQTRYFIPTETNTEKIIEEILKISPADRVENKKYSLTGSEDYGEQRDGLLSRNGKRGHNASSREQARSISEIKFKAPGKTEAERKAVTERIPAKQIKEQIEGNTLIHVIDEAAYNDDMKNIANTGKKDGYIVHFFTGTGYQRFDSKRLLPTDGIIINGKDMYLRYDGSIAPQNLYLHEDFHPKHGGKRGQEATNIILNNLSETDKKRILAEERYKNYMELYGDEDLVWEEFISDVLGGMSEYTPEFVELAADYISGNEIVDYYSPAEYNKIMDAGGENERIVDNIGFIDDYRLSMADDIPYRERRQLEEYIMHKNNSADSLPPFGCKEIGDTFYVWNNLSKTDFNIIDSIPIEGNEDLIDAWREELKNDNRRTKGFGLGNDRQRSGKRSGAISYGRTEKAGTHRGDDKLSTGQSASNEGRYSAKDSRNQASGKSKYSLDTVNNDIKELTPERKKEIFERFEKDRAGIEKTSAKQAWGERAAWVAHHMTRVFPDIPEHGEKGKFYAEFRKMMIQWKALPKTAMFMTQDKLNQMTANLTPNEFKTFSELVYFLDLQEEAQIQKERGYEEILLPNEISPHEVDQVVDILNKEATDNVKKALEKRQAIWDALKEQYITLNQYIGFDTDGKFKRKNYYHHQVIEYMNNGGKGVAKGSDIEIKAGRGWLKERQGSTKAINTDFLAVEYKAMLQMQYDVYIANMLGKIKEQYDIKPQLERQAFQNNKDCINQLIRKEAADESGDIRLDSKGKPDSAAYRQQVWYNQRIMFGFSGLFDLADRNALPTFGGEYGAVINTLKHHSLNSPGLYRYVGAVASMELPETATDAEVQAQTNARTVLKYTSQKREWIKSVLAENYQTWETIAQSMRDTHSIHQPRRGNYFYTKTTIDEDAFNKAFNDMITTLVSGTHNFEKMDDVKKLFTQYSDTVRLMGAAFEQWVLPKEIVTTMDNIANPIQAGAGARMARMAVSTWKGWATSVNPLRTVKFGTRNLVGDLDAVIAGSPQILLYSKRAVKDIYQAMKYKIYTSEFMEWVERGGYTAMIFANEMDTEMQDKLFAHLQDKNGVSIFKIPSRLFEGYSNGVEAAHNFREAILRYSAYLYYKDAIKKNSGIVKDYVASNRYIVQGLKSVEDKAYQLSKDLLGAYDEVGAMGQWLRRYLVPFYSFTETNLKKYYRLFENIIISDDKIPRKAGKLLLKGLMVNLLGLIMIAWNRIVQKDNDDELPPSTRNVPHITLGKIGDEVYAFRQLGSFSELLEWFGLEDYKWTKEDLTAPLDKAWGMITPFVKMPVELASGLNFYPSLTQPRAIRDKAEHIFNSLGVADIYREIIGKPVRSGKIGGIGEILKGSVIYSYDFKESAYYEILDIKRNYQGKNDNTIYGADDKSNALYYMKTAVRYKDKKAALKYLDEYFENGGTGKGIVQSLATLNPMYGYTGKDTMAKGEAFVKSLTEEEKEKLKIAQRFYEEDLMLPEKVAALLRKKGVTDKDAKNLLERYINSKCN